jgi:light-harvesting complex 1 beta chain
MSSNDEKPLNYLTAEEAKEFHKLFMTSFIIFTLVAIIAHFLVWQWRPWLPGPEGYAMIESGVQFAQASLTSLMA